MRWTAASGCAWPGGTDGKIRKEAVTMAEKKNVLLTFVGNTDPWFYKGSMEGRTMTCPDGLDVGPYPWPL